MSRTVSLGTEPTVFTREQRQDCLCSFTMQTLPQLVLLSVLVCRNSRGKLDLKVTLLQLPVLGAAITVCCQV